MTDPRAGRASDLLEEADRALHALESGQFDHATMNRLGDSLFTSGMFARAADLLEPLAERGGLTASGASALAALRHFVGDYDGSRAAVQVYAALRPFRHHGPDRHADAPVLLRVRAVHASHLRAIEDPVTGRIRRALQRGHFSTRALIPPETYRVITATIGAAGVPDPAELPRPDIVVNCAACGDLNAPGLRQVEGFIARWPDVPVINSPNRVLRSTRGGNALRLGSIPGVVIPRTISFRISDDLDTTLDLLEHSGLAYPLILRHAGSQTGVSMRLVAGRAAAASALALEHRDRAMIATEFRGNLSENGLYRKIRVFFIDGTLYPVVDLRSDHWNIHSADRYRVMSDRPDLMRAEQDFLSDPARVLGRARIDTLHAISKELGLDFFGVDFAPMEENRILVFEANAAMRHNFEHLETFPYRRPYLERISKAFAAMLAGRLKDGGAREQG